VNWSAGQIPGPDDDVVIDAGAITVTLSSGAQHIKSLFLASTLNIVGGTLDISSPTTVTSSGTIALDGGTLSGSGQITISGELVGTGTVTGSVSNVGGTVRPGGNGATGTLTITDDYIQSEWGTLEIESTTIGGGGATCDSTDLLSIGALATLAGTLVIDQSGCTPRAGTVVIFLVAGQVDEDHAFGTHSGLATKQSILYRTTEVGLKTAN
jgi:hypothetical protein